MVSGSLRAVLDGVSGSISYEWWLWYCKLVEADRVIRLRGLGDWLSGRDLWGFVVRGDGCLHFLVDYLLVSIDRKNTSTFVRWQEMQLLFSYIVSEEIESLSWSKARCDLG